MNDLEMRKEVWVLIKQSLEVSLTEDLPEFGPLRAKYGQAAVERVMRVIKDWQREFARQFEAYLNEMRSNRGTQ